MDSDKRQELMQESRFNLASINSLSFEELVQISESSENPELTLFYSLDGKLRDCMVTSLSIDATSEKELQFATFQTTDSVAAKAAAYVKQTYGERWFIVDYHK